MDLPSQTEEGGTCGEDCCQPIFTYPLCDASYGLFATSAHDRYWHKTYMLIVILPIVALGSSIQNGHQDELFECVWKIVS